jgi:hypothetical protein
MANRVFGNIHRDVFSAVVNRYGVPQHLGDYGAVSSPSPDDSLFVLRVQSPDFCQKLLVYIRPLLG